MKISLYSGPQEALNPNLQIEVHTQLEEVLHDLHEMEKDLEIQALCLC